MKKIYITLTYTGTILAKIVKFYTRHQYAHVSIALDNSLNVMYSFGRRTPYNLLNCGFIEENINTNVFKRFKNTKAAVYSLEITGTQYDKLQKKIIEMWAQKEIYNFNILGLFLVAAKIKRKKKNYFYCSEFVKYLFDVAEIKNNLPELIKPEDFMKVDNLKLEYQGLLREYK